ncbi:MAG: DNA polymerase III subunit beta [Hyphomicrobiaceae bacterium]|nr:DNA polymerase III subunit beta [Hyphomicrobiaceae bacterium]
MRLVIERSELMRALGHVTSVVERRTTIPILSNVLLKATGASLELKATDLEREVVEAVSAEIEQPGAVTVPAHMLHDIVRKLPDGSEVEIVRDAERERLTIRSGNSRFALQTIAADDFPDLAAGEMSHTFEVPAADLKALIEKTRFAISTEETRYYLNGIYLHTAERAGSPTLRAVATDGHRLAQLDVECPAGAAGMPGIIVPRKTVHELHRLIEATDAVITVGVSAAKVRFEIGPITLTSKLIDGTFPDYQRVIPQANDKSMKVSNATFMSAVDRVATIASERGRAVKLAIAPEKLVLSVTNPDGGSATEELPIDYSANTIEIGFNHRYLLDISGQLESDTLQFMLADPGSPTIVKDGGDDRALYVLMPMRV